MADRLGYRQGVLDADHLGRSSLQSGLGILQAMNLQRQMAYEDEAQPLKLAQLRQAVEEMRQDADLRGVLQGRLTGTGGATQGGVLSPQGAMAAGAAQGDVGPTVSNADRIGSPAGVLRPGGIPGVDPLAASLLMSKSPGMGKLGSAIQEANKPIVGRENAPILERGPDGNFRVAFSPAPKLDQGQRYDFGTGQVSTVPGFLESMAGIEGARTRAVEGAKSSHRLVAAPVGGGATQLVPESSLLTTTPYIPPAQQRQTQSNMDSGLKPDGSGPAIPTSAVLGRSQGTEEKTASETTGRETAQLVSGYRQKMPAINATLQRLNRLDALNADDKTFAAGGAELKTELGRIAQGFGIDVAPFKTASSELYLAQIGELMKDRLASKDYGSGSGVSNLDLIAARGPLPELAKTRSGRTEIINAIRLDTQQSQKDMTAAVQHFDKNLSLRDFKWPSEAGAAGGGGRAPAVGAVVDGYRFKGGNPAMQASWEKL